MCGVVSQTANAGLASQWYRAALKGVLASLEWAACAKWWGASVLAGQSAEAGARGRVCRAESAQSHRQARQNGGSEFGDCGVRTTTAAFLVTQVHTRDT